MQVIKATLFAGLIAFALPAFADSERPSAISSLTVNSTSGSAIAFSWNQPADNVGVIGYNLYRNGGYFTTVYGRTSYTDDEISAGGQYQYYIVAFDEARNYSTKGVQITATASGSSGDDSSDNNSDNDSSDDNSNDNSDDNSSDSSNDNLAGGKPSAPDGLNAQIDSSSSATLSWNTPSGGAEGYNVYIDGSYFTTIKGSNNYAATNLSSGRSYEFEVVAFRNNEFSTKSSSVTVQTSGNSNDDFTSPPPPDDDNDNNNDNNNNNDNSAVPANYELVFSEEFNSGSISSSKWNTSYRWGADWIINNEEQYYVDTQRTPGFGVNPFITNGSTLTIQATRTPDSLRSRARDQRYLSGAMTTYNKFQMTYGYVEARAKMPRGKGLWPAFWLLHATESGIRPEIDVVEMLGDNTNRVYQTYHYFDNNNLRSTPSYQANTANYANDFHTYGMLWEPGRITWYVDGVATNSYSGGNVSSESMYILLNLALGGAWAGSPDGSTPFPANFEIDYVRAYQRR